MGAAAVPEVREYRGMMRLWRITFAAAAVNLLATWFIFNATYLYDFLRRTIGYSAMNRLIDPIGWIMYLAPGVILILLVFLRNAMMATTTKEEGR